MLKRKTLAIALFATAPFVAHSEPTFYGMYGMGYTDNEPINESLDYKGNHIKDSTPVELSIGANLTSRWSIDLAAAYSPQKSDNRVDHEQYNLNGFYFLTQHKTRPYTGLTLSYEDLHVPNGIDKETLAYGGFMGVQHDFNSKLFTRLEGRFLETRSTNIEHATLMFELGYRFGGSSLAFVKTKTTTQPTAEETQPEQKEEIATVDQINQLPPTAAGIKDADSDGIRDDLDECPSTTQDLTVDEKGCPTFTGTLSSIQFQSGSSELTDDSESYLAKMAKELSAYPDLKIQIVAHTDSQGRSQFNQALSAKRADAVRDYLITQDISGSNLTSKGMGEDNPIADNGTIDGRAKNRRVEFIVEK